MNRGSDANYLSVHGVIEANFCPFFGHFVLLCIASVGSGRNNPMWTDLQPDDLL